MHLPCGHCGCDEHETHRRLLPHARHRGRNSLATVAQVDNWTVAASEMWEANMIWPNYEAAAKRGHMVYEHRAPAYGYETRKATRVAWWELSCEMRALMIEAYTAGVTAALDGEELYRVDNDEHGIVTIDTCSGQVVDYDMSGEMLAALKGAGVIVQVWPPKEESWPKAKIRTTILLSGQKY